MKKDIRDLIENKPSKVFRALIEGLMIYDKCRDFEIALDLTSLCVKDVYKFGPAVCLFQRLTNKTIDLEYVKFHYPNNINLRSLSSFFVIYDLNLISFNNALFNCLESNLEPIFLFCGYNFSNLKSEIRHDILNHCTFVLSNHNWRERVSSVYKLISVLEKYNY